MPEIQRIADQPKPYESPVGKQFLIYPCVCPGRNHKSRPECRQQGPPPRESARFVQQRKTQRQKSNAQNGLKVPVPAIEFRLMQNNKSKYAAKH